MKRRNVLLLAAALGASLLGGMALQPKSPLGAQEPQIARRPDPLLVSAAASLQEVMEAIQPGFEAAHPEIALTYNFGSSGALQQQIEQGAPVDVFISAGVSQMDALENQGRLRAGSRQSLWGNQLVLIVPANSTLNLDDFSDLTGAGVERISVGEFRSVPAGQYAEQVFTSLGLLADLQPKLVFANNVRGVLAAVESGNVDAGVVYATDAALSERVTVAAIADEDLHRPITYPLAILAETANPEAAEAFVAYLASDATRALLTDFGFTPLD
jgi:molybdate transport system substrate-binding protein